MKKLLLSFSLILGFCASAQDMETTTSGRQNEVMLSPIELIAAPALNISYERLLSKDSGIGINGIFLLQDNNNEESSYLSSQISPYYRMYFGKKYAAGFFVEAFVPITTTNDRVYGTSSFYNGNFYLGKDSYKKNTTIGAGIGFGGKWVTRKNITFEVSGGIARRFGSGNFDKITGKGMLGIGYRF